MSWIEKKVAEIIKNSYLNGTWGEEQYKEVDKLIQSEEKKIVSRGGRYNRNYSRMRDRAVEVREKIEREYESYFRVGGGYYDRVNGNEKLKSLLASCRR